MHTFAVADEAMPGRLPHSWAVTSDSLAVRVAQVAGIRKLVLLKSCDVPASGQWSEAVDAAFADSLAAAGPALEVTMINFRQWCCFAANAAVQRDPAL